MVKERWKLFEESLTETISMSKKEFLLMIVAGILGGIVFGMLFSPRKYTMIGCQNGNNGANINGLHGEQQVEEKKNIEK